MVVSGTVDCRSGWDSVRFAWICTYTPSRYTIQPCLFQVIHVCAVLKNEPLPGLRARIQAAPLALFLCCSLSGHRGLRWWLQVRSCSWFSNAILWDCERMSLCAHTLPEWLSSQFSVRNHHLQRHEDGFHSDIPQAMGYGTSTYHSKSESMREKVAIAQLSATCHL